MGGRSLVVHIEGRSGRRNEARTHTQTAASLYLIFISLAGALASRSAADDDNDAGRRKRAVKRSAA